MDADIEITKLQRNYKHSLVLPLMYCMESSEWLSLFSAIAMIIPLMSYKTY